MTKKEPPSGAKPNMSKSRAVSAKTHSPDEIANLMNSPTLNAAAVIAAFAKEPFQKYGDLDLAAAMRDLGALSKDVQSGDLGRIEAMLLSQAHALQTMFTHLSRRALCQDRQPNLESFFRMSLKAQNQCRMTLETLATVKQGPAIFAKQANVNNGGQQQVNNGAASLQPATTREVSAAPAEKSKPEQNELLEAPSGERMDFGTTSTAGRVDTQLEAVGEVDRPTKRRGQGKSVAQRVHGGTVA